MTRRNKESVLIRLDNVKKYEMPVILKWTNIG